MSERLVIRASPTKKLLTPGMTVFQTCTSRVFGSSLNKTWLSPSNILKILSKTKSRSSRCWKWPTPIVYNQVSQKLIIFNITLWVGKFPPEIAPSFILLSSMASCYFQCYLSSQHTAVSETHTTTEQRNRYCRRILSHTTCGDQIATDMYWDMKLFRINYLINLRTNTRLLEKGFSFLQDGFQLGQFHEVHLQVDSITAGLYHFCFNTFQLSLKLKWRLELFSSEKVKWKLVGRPYT